MSEEQVVKGLIRRSRCAGVALVLVAAHAALVGAQSTRQPYVQLALGKSTLTGGVKSDRQFPVVELAAGTRPLPGHLPAFTLGVVVGSSILSGGSLECPLTPQGQCARFVDSYHSAALLAGIEWQGRLGTLSASAGPAVFSSDAGAGRGASARGEYSSPAFRRMALVVSQQLLIVPRVQADRHTFRSVSVGLRLR